MAFSGTFALNYKILLSELSEYKILSLLPTPNQNKQNPKPTTWLQISFEEKDSKYFHANQEVNHKLFTKIPKLICIDNLHQFTKIFKYKKNHVS